MNIFQPQFSKNFWRYPINFTDFFVCIPFIQFKVAVSVNNHKLNVLSYRQKIRIIFPEPMAQVVNFTGLLQLVNKLQQACKFLQVATSMLRSGLLQLVICRLVTTCWNKLQQACWQLATDLLSQAVASHANASWYRLVATGCYKISTGLLQLGRFWLYNWNATSISFVAWSDEDACLGEFPAWCVFLLRNQPLYWI